MEPPELDEEELAASERRWLLEDRATSAIGRVFAGAARLAARRRRAALVLIGVVAALGALGIVASADGTPTPSEDEVPTLRAVVDSPAASECVAVARELVAWSRGLQEAGRFVEALASVEGARRASVRCPDPSLQMEIMAARGAQLGRIGRVGEGVAELEAAARRATQNEQTEALADIAVELVALHGVERDDIERARRWAGRAGELLPELPDGGEHRASLQLHLGTALTRVGAYDEAEERINDAIDLRAQALGAGHHGTEIARGALASLQWARGERREAVWSWKRRLEALEVSLGPDHYEVGRIAGRLAMAASNEGRHEDAADLFKRALAIAERSTGRTPRGWPPRDGG